MALSRKFKVAHDEVFPFGAYLVSEVQPMFDFERSTRDQKVQDVDKDTGLLMWSVDVLDADPEAPKKSKTVTVKFAAKVQPVPPSNDGSSPFTSVVFEGLTATPWVDSSRCNAPESGKAHRCRAQSAWSFRATGMAPAKAAPKTDSGSTSKAA